jgi:hypothetical protein
MAVWTIRSATFSSHSGAGATLKVWEQKLNHDEGHGIYISPSHLRNAGPDGKGLDIVVTWSDKVLRATDGSVIIEKTGLPVTGQRWNAGIRLARDDRFMIGGSPGEGCGETAQYRITWENGQPVVKSFLHFDQPRGGPGERQLDMAGPCQVLLAGKPVMVAGNIIYDWNTGRILGQNFGMYKNRAFIGGLLTIDGTHSVIGRTALNCATGRQYGRGRVNLSTAEPHKMMDVSDPRHPRMRSVWNLIGGAEYPSDIIFETWLPKADMAEFWLRAAYSGLPGWLGGGQCAAQAQGDKVFLQTYKYLYCLGPAVKGTASDDPKVVAAIRAQSDPAKLEEYLKHASAQYRYEAALRMTTASEILKKLAVEDTYEEIRAAAIHALEKAQAGSGKAVLVAQLVEHADKRYGWFDVEEHKLKAMLAETCKRLGDLADTALGEALGKVKNTNRLFEVTAYGNLCGPAVGKACLATLAATKPGSKDLDLAGCSAAETLAWGGKAVANAAAITTFLEAQLPLWDDGAPNGIVSDAWKAFDDILAVPAVRPRLIALLGTMLGQPLRGNNGGETTRVILLRHIEELGVEAAAMKSKFEELKEKDKQRADWYDRIIAGMNSK